MPKDEEYRNTLIDCCRGVPKCAVVLLSLPATYNALCVQLRNGVANAVLFRKPQAQHYAEEYPGDDKQYWVDRKYNGNRNRYLRLKTDLPRENPRNRGNFTAKRCFVCKKPGCWSTKHTKEEQSTVDFEGAEDKYEPDDGDGPFDGDIFFTSTAFYGKDGINGQKLNSKAPGRFKFTLHDDHEFNNEIIVDVMYLDGNKPVLHVVDAATAFNAARFLRAVTAEHTWEALRMCWIDVYLGPPDWIVTDAGLNFHAAEFKRAARALSIDVKEIPIEAHN
ncbi:putative conserved hypothetical protein, partial [Colletotrichum sublineola]